MKNGTLYSDGLVEIDDDSMLVRGFYLFGDKRVRFEDIDRIVVKKPTVRSGKYRYAGTGDFRTWFPPDDRTSRDRVFIIKIKKKWWRIGLTVTDSQKVLDLLKGKCSVVDESAQ